MPEDIFDKLVDFEMMLEGFVLTSSDVSPAQEMKQRLLAYWYAISNEIKEQLEKE